MDYFTTHPLSQALFMWSMNQKGLRFGQGFYSYNISLTYHLENLFKVSAQHLPKRTLCISQTALDMYKPDWARNRANMLQTRDVRWTDGMLTIGHLQSRAKIIDIYNCHIVWLDLGLPDNLYTNRLIKVITFLADIWYIDYTHSLVNLITVITDIPIVRQHTQVQWIIFITDARIFITFFDRLHYLYHSSSRVLINLITFLANIQ